MKTIVVLTHVGFDNSPYCSYVHNHAKALAKLGYNVIAIATINWIPIFSRFQKYKQTFMKNINNKSKKQTIDGVTVIYKKVLSFSNLLYNSKININGFCYYLGIKRLFKRINKLEDITLIDAHTFKVEGYVAYRLKKKYPNIITTVTLHGTSFERNYKTINGKKQICKILKNMDYSICVSDKIKNEVVKLNITNTKLIYNGINQYELLNSKRHKFSIITVGNLVKLKNIDIVINAVSKICKKYKEIKLTIAGDGVEKDKLIKLVNDLNISDKILFKGRISNKEVRKLMNESEIFILPSKPEGFGIVYIEAMQSGCITIGTKGEGIDGMIQNNKNGFLVNPNINEIYELINNIYEGKFNIDKIINNGIETTKKLTWENNAEEYIKLIK
jgi:glycosyltransferase involved in cell wall biosynthesis